MFLNRSLTFDKYKNDPSTITHRFREFEMQFIHGRQIFSRGGGWWCGGGGGGGVVSSLFSLLFLNN
jgi:hypothetical protein